jgi:hypothetical protein
MKFFKQQSIHERKIGDRSLILTADGNVEIDLGSSNRVNITGDLRVSGNTTGPKVSNVYYVTEDGNDLNDGRSAGPDGAFASIKRAAEVAPEGSTIIVAPGDYVEENPITLRDFVTVTGQGELRNTRIFPKNRQRTIFYVGNGCYLYQLTFRALRAPGWCVEIRPGTLCTTSPYVQNCTNMNGPWLNDGTEFIPFETVQLEGINPGARPLMIEDYPDLPFAKQINIDGGGGGMFVDGDAYDPASLVFSMVADAFTQIAQGGIGFWIDNFGYTQIVSCFSVFCSVGFLTTRGGYLSISNSVSDFGTIGVKADGFYPIPYTNAVPSQAYFSSVGSVTINNPGSGYTSAPAVIFEAPLGAGGVTATGTAQVDLTTGALAAVSIINPGSGYTKVPAISFVGGDAIIQAEGTVNLTTNSVIEISSLRDKPQTGSIIQFQGNDTYYYITSTNVTVPPFVYDESVCRRDIRRMVDAVAGDIVLGTNYQSITAAQSYLRATASKVLLDQLSPTIYGLESARDQMKLQTNNLAMKEEIDQRFNIVTSVLSAGDSAGLPDIIYNDLSSIDIGNINAKDNVVVNRDFIIQELTSYINDQFTELSYNQTQYATDMTNLLNGIAMYISLGSDQQVIRQGQEFKTRNRFKSLMISSFEYLRSRTLALIEVSGSVTATTRVNEAFNQFINIVDDGDSSGITIEFVEHSGAAANRIDTKDQLQANKDFLTEEFVAFIKDDNPIFTWGGLDEATYKEYFGYIVDALTFDMLYGGNSSTVQEAIYFFDNINYSRLLNTEVQTVVDAFARMRFVLQRVIRGLSVTPTLGNLESQDFSSGTATLVEANIIDSTLQIIENVVDNGTSTGLPAKSYPILTTESSELQNASNQILSQRNGFISDAIAYNLVNNPTLTYDVEKCKRDVGFILDAIYRDAQLGTNHNSITAALAYSRANTAFYNVEQRPATIIALREAKRLIIAASNRDPSFQESATNLFEDILNIIEFDQLPSEGTVYPEPGPASTELINATEQLVANRAFLAAEVIAFINDNNFVYDQAKCRRDTGLIVDASYYDAALGTNYNAVTAGLAYRRANSAYVLSDQITQTVGAITFAKGEAETATSSDVTAQNRVSAAWAEILDILQNGVASADALTFANPTTATTAQINAKDQLQNNRNFLAAEAVAFIQNNYENFSYNQSQFEDDVSFVMDAVALDTVLGTNYNAVTAGLSFQRASRADLQDNQLLQYGAAFRELKKQIVLLGLSDTAQPRAEAAMDEIIDILENGVLSTDTAADALVFPAPPALPTPDAVEAKDQLIANRAFIQAEIISWINTNFPALTYDQTKCSRDIGYIVDALCHDILYGGNTATLQAAQSYFVGAVSQLGAGQQDATAGAFNRLGQVVGDIVIEAPVVKTGSYPEVQDTSGIPASSTEVDELSGLVKIIEDVIIAGNLSGLPSVSNPLIVSFDDDLEQAYNVIKGNKSQITADLVTFITDNFQSFTFDGVRCERDTKYIVDALTYDILYGGNSATVAAANAYWVGAVSQVEGQQTETAAALEWIKTLLGDVLLDVAVANPEQTAVTQNNTAGAASATEVTKANTLLQVFQDVIQNGIDNLPIVTYPDVTWATAGIQSAVANLEAEKQNIIDATINFIAITYNGFSYDQEVCRRDTGFLIDAVAHDLLYEGNIATLIATRAYFLGAVQYIPESQRANTVAAYAHLATIAEACIEGIAVAPTSGNNESQVLSGNYGTSVESARATELFNITKNAINNATLVGTPGEVEPNFNWLPEATRVAAAALLAQKVNIQNSVIEFITENIVGFEYNIEKCQRDTGYLVDAALYDMMYGGNKQTRRAAEAYYNGAILGAARVGNSDQTLVTAYSYYKLGDLLRQVSKNDVVTKSFGNVEIQDTTIPDGSDAAANYMELLIDRIAQSLIDGFTTGWQELDHNYELGSGVYNTERLTILSNLQTIEDFAIADLNATFGGTAEISLFPGLVSVDPSQQGNLYNVSTISTSGHAFEYVGAGVTYNALPFFGGSAIPEQEIQEFNQGKVFAGGTVDQIGNFRVGNFFGVNALTGAITINANQIDLSGLTSVGPFIRDGIPVGVELKEVSDSSNLVSSIGTVDFNTVPTQRAVSVYVENRYLNKLTGGTITGNLVLDGDFDVNGDVISTAETGPFSLLNTSATTINAFGAATEINIGAADGLVTINPDLLVEGSLTVNGDIVFTGDVSLNIPDESLQAYSITTEGSLDYISINTRTDEEIITFGIRPQFLVENTTEATSTTNAAVVFDGGLGVAKSVFIGGDLTANGSVILGNDRAVDTIDINGVTDIDVPDNATSVFRVHENISDYIIVDTTDNAEVVEFGSVPNVIILNNDDATDSVTGALQVTGGISTQRNLHAGVDITADRDIIADRDIEVNGTNIITDETGTFNVFNTNATTINAFGTATTINIGAQSGTLNLRNEQIIIDSVQTLQIPVGTTLERPSPITGQIRFNLDTTVFEGYDGIAWGSLGGVKDVDQNTFVRPETSPGANNDELEFFTNGSRRLVIGNNTFIVESTNPVQILNTTVSSDYQTGALVVSGGVGIAEELHVQKYISGNNDGVLQLTELASDKILIKADTIESPEQLRFITGADDSSGNEIIYPITLVNRSDGGTVVAGAGTGIKFELETSNDNFEIGGQIDIIAQDVTGTQEDFDMVFSTMISGSVVEKLRLGENTSTFSTDITINNDSLLTTQTTFNLLNDTATTINFAGAATVLNIGATGGLTTVNQNVKVNENVTIDGTLALTNIDLEVQYGGTGVSTFTVNGIVYGDAANPLNVTDAAGTSDASNSFQILTVTSDVDATPVWTDTIDGGSF